MSKIVVDTITGAAGTYVNIVNGMTGDASNLTLRPNIIAFSPEPLSDTAAVNTNISVTFSQPISFSGVGTITIRSGFSTGPIVAQYDTQTAPELSIADSILTINPSSDLAFNTKHYVEFSEIGIANTHGVFYAGSNSYNFNTVATTFEITGGTYSFVREDPTSLTGHYKYHIFTGTQAFTLNQPSTTALQLTWMLVGGGGAGGNCSAALPTNSPANWAGGGGGAGGLLQGDETSLNLPGPGGPYTFTQGAGGSRVANDTTITSSANGNDSTITSPTATIHTAFGGGRGGGYPGQTPSEGTGANGGSGGGGSGFTQPTTVTYPSPLDSSSGATAPAYPGGTGVAGQGNAGGTARYKRAPTTTPGSWNTHNLPGIYVTNGGGGGGAGASGGSAFSPAVDANPIIGSPWFAVDSGNGGAGIAVTAFNGLNLIGQVPDSDYPNYALLHPTLIGPAGTYAGGGGGGSVAGPGADNYNHFKAGAGGSGGGGYGAWIGTTNGPNPYPFGTRIVEVRPGPELPEPHSPQPSQYRSQSGFQFTGGGGGGSSPGPSSTSPSPGGFVAGAGLGGSGVFMVRYAYIQS